MFSKTAGHKPTRSFKVAVFLGVIGAALAMWSSAASACGGFFCQNTPVDQTGERIVFTVNPDETITTLIEILYQGEAEDFSWILPIPETITADALQVPEDGAAVFDELHQLTDVQVIAPPQPDCTADFAGATAESAADSGVDVFGSGEVGPFGFDIVGSESPDALVTWLRDNDYLVTEAMEPLIDIYVEQENAFIAMRLLDGETSDSIAPIEITYPGTEPLIPLQLTAVAAQPNLPVWVWIFGESQAVPTNFEHMEIANEELTFFPFGGHDYTFLVQQRANALDGRAFITEYAQPVETSEFSTPWLIEQADTAPYLTRLSTFLDPEEMTADPTFGFDPERAPVSNIRDASNLEGLYSCERDSGGFLGGIFGSDSGDAIDPRDGGDDIVAITPVSQTSSDDSPQNQDFETDSGAADGDGSESAQGLPQSPVGDDPGSGLSLALVVALVVLAAGGFGVLALRQRRA